MDLPPLEARIEMFLEAVAGRCKSCVERGRCYSCLSLDARRLLADIKLARVSSTAERVRTTGLTEADKAILGQLANGRIIRGDKLRFPYEVSGEEKRQIMQRLIDRGLVAYELYGKKGHQFRCYKLP